MTIGLHDLFCKFADCTQDRFRLGPPRKEKTRFVVEFFHEYLQSLGFGDPDREYMGVDAVWRDPHLRYIAVALEHENSHNMGEFLRKEMQHLVDLKAQVKVAIAYPHAGEETESLKEIARLIQQVVNMTTDIFGEDYLIVFGFDTWRDRKPAIQWKGYILNRLGEVQGPLERIVPQALRAATRKSRLGNLGSG